MTIKLSTTLSETILPEILSQNSLKESDYEHNEAVKED